MPPRRKNPLKPRKKPSQRQPNGHVRGGYRVALARRLLASGVHPREIKARIIERFSVHPATVDTDIAEARRRNEEVTDKRVPELIHRNTVRLDSIADMAEEDGKYSDAVQALREVHRIHGMHAPKKLVVTGQVAVSLDIQAVVAILDDKGLAALEVVIAQITAAQARGELTEAAPVDADVVEPDEDDDHMEN